MTTPADSAHPRRRLRWLVLALAAVCLGVAVGVLNAVTLTRDAHLLRTTVVSAADLRPNWRLQGSVGPMLCQLGRVGLRYIKDVPPEARASLDALRGASVAVHELAVAPDATQQTRWMAEAKRRMTGRGWTQTVSVVDGADAVVVFTRRDGGLRHRLRVCVAVCSGNQLVVAEAKLDEQRLHALLALVADRLPEGAWPS